RQMRDQVGVCGPQDQEVFPRGQPYPRSFLNADQLVRKDFAADGELAAAAQRLQVSAPLAIDKQNRVVFIEAGIQRGSTLRLIDWITQPRGPAIDCRIWRRLRLARFGGCDAISTKCAMRSPLIRAKLL